MSRPSRPRARVLSRRVLLADLGRATLGAVVLGPVVAGCAADEPAAQDPIVDAPGVDDDPAATDDGAASQLRWARAPFGFVSAFVLVRDGAATVFDTGTGEDGIDPIEAALSELAVGWGDVADVIVSHSHGDHSGGVGAVAAAAPQATFAGAVPDLDSFREDAGGNVREVVDGDTVGGLRIVATPGHTEGHVSAFDAASGLLLAGDALTYDSTAGGGAGDGFGGSPPRFTWDEAIAVDSVRLLAGLSPSTVLVGHGDPVQDAAAELQTFADSL